MNGRWSKNRRGTTQITIALACVIAVPGAYVFAADNSGQYTATELADALQQTARDMNRRLPRMIDEEIRLDSTQAGRREFRYNYTVVKYLASEVDRTVVQNKTHKRLRESFCRGEAAQVFIAYRIPVTYAYFGKDGKEIAKIRINPAQC